MVDPDFKRFFDEVILPAQASAEVSMPPIPVSKVASAEAKYLLENVKGPSHPADLNDKKMRSDIRNVMNKYWKSAEKYLGADVTSQEQTIAGINCKIFTPGSLKNPKQKLLYLHGGGYWLGSADANSSIAISIAEKSGIEVVSVDYRLAPEHPYPAAQEDTLTVYKALLAAGTKPGDIALIGDSAGAGLALSVAIEIRDKNFPAPAALAVISPWTDLTFSGDSHKANNFYTDPWLSVEGLTLPAKAYAGSLELSAPEVSPLFADLHDLPPMIIHVGTREILLSDATRLATKAKQAGVDVTIDIYEEMWHCWHFYPHVPEAQKACADIAAFFSRHMS